MAEPMLPLAAGGAVIALLGGLFFYRRHQAKKQLNHVDSSFLESRLPTDSFFDASGGARVDTMRETGNSSSSANAASAVYANSQMENPDDVDPVAEADVYLAYGRDLQAEEILKEALRHAPERLAIHAKLLEIFAKRRDAASYEETARRVQALTGGNESAESATGSHATKLALAEEFVSIGDDDGARALIEEVIADASGPLLEQARAALARLN